ncbi:MAG: ATP-binding protein, partial [Phycisphaerales bacterium]
MPPRQATLRKIEPTLSGWVSPSSSTILRGTPPARRSTGSTDGRGVMHCVWELIDTAVDEALAGHAKNIYITLHDDGSVFVEDDGRGIP